MTTQTEQSNEWVRFETLPFGALDRELDGVDHPLTLTVTCSPVHGNDHTLDVSQRLRERGHRVVVHIAARMVRSETHLDEIASRLHGLGIEDVFLVGGDQAQPLGPYARGLDLLPALRAHAEAPKRIGVPAYPEGHPLIEPQLLLDDLREKALIADYMVTQLCFQPRAITDWLAATRDSGIELPVWIGLPGLVDRKRLLEISLRVGVGTSIRYLRKQRGFTRLFGGMHKTAEGLYDAVTPLVGNELGIAGIHLFTFNRLVETARFVELRSAEASKNRRAAPAANRGATD